MIDIEILKCTLSDHSWELAEVQPDKYYLRYKKDGDIFDYWFTTGTVRVIKNNKAKYYRDVTLEMVSKLLQ